MYYTQRLKEIREKSELTQQEIADGLGIARQQYRRYEAGINEIKAGHIIRLCNYYNLSADYILALTDEPRELHK